MIYKLQKKFILISAVSVLSVIVLMFALTAAFNVSSVNKTLDILADRVAEGGGRFENSPEKPLPGAPSHGEPSPNEPSPEVKPELMPNGAGGEAFGFITPETPFSTRHFSVWLNSDGTVERVNTESIYLISDENAIEYAKGALKSGNERGWADSYRYKILRTENGCCAVFIDGSLHTATLTQSLTIMGAVLLASAALVLILIILLSKRVVEPIAAAYDKQRQFITDANHELKTPLTLILANLDILEADTGKNEWIDDIRDEGERMSKLVNELVALSRLDENTGNTSDTELLLSEIVCDTVSEFQSSAASRGLTLTSEIRQGIKYTSDEALMRRLLSVLLDNALKYCDEGGTISVSLEEKHGVVLRVENSFSDVECIELGKLFDRFYRSDKSRSTSGGFGIGLSIAKAIVERHRGEISAYKSADSVICFRAILR
ncbi:MAG: HAMP domain-containing histidine kinase [Clostridia bacterium]|nr:HAMP domain-containing histidine kinase [Clostridia bacterium]